MSPEPIIFNPCRVDLPEVLDVMDVFADKLPPLSVTWGKCAYIDPLLDVTADGSLPSPNTPSHGDRIGGRTIMIVWSYWFWFWRFYFYTQFVPDVSWLYFVVFFDVVLSTLPVNVSYLRPTHAQKHNKKKSRVLDHPNRICRGTVFIEGCICMEPHT